MLSVFMIGLMSFSACFLVLCCFLDKTEVGLRSTQTGGPSHGVPDLNGSDHQQVARVHEVRHVPDEKAA